MNWHTRELSPGNFLIETLVMGQTVVIGSILQRPTAISTRWDVEIMWQGPHGDYKFDGATYKEALSYVQGVESAQSRCLDAFAPETRIVFNKKS